MKDRPFGNHGRVDVRASLWARVVLRAQSSFANEDATARHASLKPWLGRERARKLASPVASGRIHVDAASWSKSRPPGRSACAVRRFAPSSRAGRIPPPFAQRPPPWQGSGPGQGAQGTTCCGPKRRGSVAGDPSALSHPPTHHFPSALLRDVPRFIRRTKSRTVACTNDSAQSSPLRSRHIASPTAPLGTCRGL